MAEELKSLKLKRSILKRRLTNLCKFLEKFTEGDDIVQIQSRRPLAEEIFKEFGSIQTEIEILDGSDENFEFREAVEIQYFNFITGLTKIVEKTANNVNIQNLPPISSNPVNNIQVKLPTLNLPQFTGLFTEWQSFSDTFNSLIHNNSSLSDTQRFHYLKSCLKGDALKAIEALPISVANYAKVFEILEKRYDNRRLIVTEHVKQILKLAPIQKASHIALRQLIDIINSNLKALEVLKQPVDQWDAVLVPIITEKLDYNTSKEWQSKLNAELPKLSQLLEFLETRYQFLESINLNSTPRGFNSNNNNTHKYKGKSYTVNSYVASKKPSCLNCKRDNHFIYQCSEFLKLNVSERIKNVTKLNLCKNCLRDSHSTENCKLTFRCRECKQKHNSLLHINNNQEEIPNTNVVNAIQEVAQINTAAHCSNNQVQVLLSTAIVKIKDNEGNYHDCRALLDPGSQSNFISKSLCDKLKFKVTQSEFTISGINQINSHVSSSAYIDLKSNYNNYKTSLHCLVIPKITNNLPQKTISLNMLKIPKNIVLADPQFNVAKSVDLLIGAERFWELLCCRQVKLDPLQPHFQETHLGWIAGGKLKGLNSYNFVSCNFATNNDLTTQVKKFWELENFGCHKINSNDSNICEVLFSANHKRDSAGRFIVPLLTKADTISLGMSKDIAIKRFYNLEERLSKNSVVKKQYIDFMREYLNLGHMELIPDPDNNDIDTESYYMPHHFVLKESSVSTKLRVVFDASSKSSNGLSLNDNLLAGPTIQQDLFSILTRFRTHTFVFTADISKMYRQIKVADSYTNYQRIVWRESSNESLKTYKLTTVTYGTTCAPFLAVRCLKQLALENKENNPNASSIIGRDMYIDDLLSGCNTIEETIKLRNDITKILSDGGFQLCKMAANNTDILPVEDQQCETPLINFDKNGFTKALGIIWNCQNDQFKYEIKLPSLSDKITKRSILSLTAKIFDPLGILAPVVLISKLIIQKLWSIDCHWDDLVPNTVTNQWTSLMLQLPTLNNLQIPRHVLAISPTCIQLHGFCDASEKAYGAVIYLKSINSNGEIYINLLCAKSRVAPLKKVTLPRLELCGALLLATLTDKVLKSLNLNINKKYFWTDSKIVLSWLAADSSKWKTFVSNRVADIQSLTSINEWYHIKGSENPADVISRGLLPQQLIDSKLWWHGPSCLHDPLFNPNTTIQDAESNNSTDIEKRRIVLINVVQEPEYFLKFSVYSKLERVTAYILRFINNCRHKEKQIGSLTTQELNNANNIIIQIVQKISFKIEIDNLKLGNEVPKSSKLLSLSPFLDNDDIIRVGGRLKNSIKISYEQKFPIILPKGHYITNLIIKYYHVKQLHAGPQLTLASIREKFWITSGRSAVRQVINKCIICFKAKPKIYQQKMGNLPAIRIEPARPFYKSGVDYCGPINVKEGRGRGKRTIKSYIALFICLVTKAVHIELVADLTTDSFLNALRRFISRRGTVGQIISDNATNFIGAKNRLNELYQFFKESEFVSKVIEPLSNDRIQWSFMPPKSPNFGGIYESNIKSLKFHLKRITENALLTFEEMYTVLTRIEACLNSRPLTPLSNEPHDLQALTPGHFLIGESLTAPVEPNLRELSVNRLSRWQFIEKLRQDFWRRWSREYLGQLQTRTKWRQESEVLLKVGTMVVLVEDNLPPLQWALGRIEALHPGNDGLTRVVSVRTSKGLFKRCVSKVCVLPIEV